MTMRGSAMPRLADMRVAAAMFVGVEMRPACVQSYWYQIFLKITENGTDNMSN